MIYVVMSEEFDENDRRCVALVKAFTSEQAANTYADSLDKNRAHCDKGKEYFVDTVELVNTEE